LAVFLTRTKLSNYYGNISHHLHTFRAINRNQTRNAMSIGENARRNIEAQLFEVEDKINKFEGLQG